SSPPRDFSLIDRYLHCDCSQLLCGPGLLFRRTDTRTGLAGKPFRELSPVPAPVATHGSTRQLAFAPEPLCHRLENYHSGSLWRSRNARQKIHPDQPAGWDHLGRTHRTAGLLLRSRGGFGPADCPILSIPHPPHLLSRRARGPGSASSTSAKPLRRLKTLGPSCPRALRHWIHGYLESRVGDPASFGKNHLGTRKLAATG